jgi:hypothetical protein
MRKHPLASADNLLRTERLIADAMRRIRFGRFESIPILRGELVLDPWPTCIRDIKFGIRTLVFRHGTPLTMQVDERLIVKAKSDA